MASGKPFKIGIIGGTGLEDPKIFENAREVYVNTPYGDPSDALIEGEVGGVKCVLCSRHGRKHQFSPSNLNYRANIWALKSLGVSVIIVSNACGSLKEEFKPGDIAIFESFIDRTTQRTKTFYGGEPNHPKGVCHIPLHPLFNEPLRQVLVECAQRLGLRHHAKGTMICIEGPAYSTRAESELYRSWGAALIGMTICPESVLAKELGIPYASIALVTDYDCWKDTHEGVSVDLVEKTLRENAANTKLLFIEAVKAINATSELFTAEVEKARKLAIDAVMLDPKEKALFTHI